MHYFLSVNTYIEILKLFSDSVFYHYYYTYIILFLIWNLYHPQTFLHLLKVAKKDYFLCISSHSLLEVICFRLLQFFFIKSPLFQFFLPIFRSWRRHSWQQCHFVVNKQKLFCWVAQFCFFAESISNWENEGLHNGELFFILVQLTDI